MTVKTEKISKGKAHTRYYAKDGKRLPGVTTILGVISKPALVPWANKLGLQGIDTRSYVDALADVGTLAHYWGISILKGDPEPDLSAWSKEHQDLASNSVIKLIQWADQHQIEVIDTELPLVSEEYRYGGTLDVLCKVDGQPGVLDLKTSKAIYVDHLYQVSAYRQLVIENGYEADWVRVLQIGRTEDEGFTVRHVSGPELDGYWQVFRDALSLYGSIKAAKKI